MTKKKKQTSKCEDCLYFDVVDESGEQVCTMSLDEDEMYAFLRGAVSSCPYYRQYDEYKSVQKQN